MGVLLIIYIFFILLISLLITQKLSKFVKSNWVYWLMVAHYFFTLAYYYYVLKNGGDANMYYEQATLNQNIEINLELGTQVIIQIATFFVYYLNFSKIALFILFGFFGYIGFYYFVKMIWASNQNFKTKYVQIILFLPGFHFWTSALGKDSLIFMFLMLFFYTISRNRFNILLLVFSFIGIYLIRPHMAMVVLLSVSLAYLLTNPLKFDILKFFFLSVSVIAIYYLRDKVMQYVGIEKLDTETLIQQMDMYNSYGATNVSEDSSYVDVSNYSIPAKLFAYLFRPLFYDARSVLKFIVSVENLFILFLIYMWLKSINFRLFTWFAMLRMPYKIIAIYFLVGWFVLAMNMYNIGLAFRQKYMLLPLFFILMLGNNLYNQKPMKNVWH